MCRTPVVPLPTPLSCTDAPTPTVCAAPLTPPPTPGLPAGGRQAAGSWLSQAAFGRPDPDAEEFGRPSRPEPGPAASPRPQRCPRSRLHAPFPPGAAAPPFASADRGSNSARSPRTSILLQPPQLLLGEARPALRHGPGRRHRSAPSSQSPDCQHGGPGTSGFRRGRDWPANQRAALWHAVPPRSASGFPQAPSGLAGPAAGLDGRRPVPAQPQRALQSSVIGGAGRWRRERRRGGRPRPRPPWRAPLRPLTGAAPPWANRCLGPPWRVLRSPQGRPPAVIPAAAALPARPLRAWAGLSSVLNADLPGLPYPHLKGHLED